MHQLWPGVSIHAPARGATWMPQKVLRTGCFNPRTRTGCDTDRAESRTDEAVSIHAPARGATGYIDRGSNLIEVSIHAPARGATEYLTAGGAEIRVSIHAPARGATV
ncbi:Putative cytoplasmic protein (fragment) [Syntrophaceticus schinkii]|uniref:Putative cytoplasmic protein n=1 Tax=Syntrophaceticus schinkii TaxID=499207 RepID=A0A0B7MEZ3_9FIRM